MKRKKEVKEIEHKGKKVKAFKYEGDINWQVEK